MAVSQRDYKLQTSYRRTNDIDDALTSVTAGLHDAEAEDFDVASRRHPRNNNGRRIVGARSEASDSTGHCVSHTHIHTLSWILVNCSVLEVSSLDCFKRLLNQVDLLQFTVLL